MRILKTLWKHLLATSTNRQFNGFTDETGKYYGNDDIIPIDVKLTTVYEEIQCEKKSMKEKLKSCMQLPTNKK